ncbi:MAG: hypothetical protein ABSD78_13360 [Acidimicrobiales bacterium]
MTGDDFTPMRASSFLPHTGSAFTVTGDVEGSAGGDAAGAEIVLEEVALPPELGEESPCFVLTFSGPLERPIGQRIHELRHDVMGEIELFLVPVGPAHGRLTYEAVFNNP